MYILATIKDLPQEGGGGDNTLLVGRSWPIDLVEVVVVYERGPTSYGLHVTFSG